MDEPPNPVPDNRLTVYKAPRREMPARRKRLLDFSANQMSLSLATRQAIAPIAGPAPVSRSSPDRFQRLTYEKDFRIAFLEARGDNLQALFDWLMSNRFPGDFQPCRPWGIIGDRKNDGYLPSQRTLYQVYAPNEITSDKTIKKIKEDFAGAKVHWKKYFDKWTFVHNDQTGKLPPQVIEQLAKLRRENPQITIETMGWTEFQLEFQKLDLAPLESKFGVAPGEADKSVLEFADLRAVLDHVAVTSNPPPAVTKDVPPHKIEFNMLSSAVGSFLKVGMEKYHVVDDFFERYRNPIYRGQIAGAFKSKYNALREEPIHPDEVFGRLEAWAGGAPCTQPRRRVAVLAVMAYLFDRCDIFEEPIPRS